MFYSLIFISECFCKSLENIKLQVIKNHKNVRFTNIIKGSTSNSWDEVILGFNSIFQTQKINTRLKTEVPCISDFSLKYYKSYYLDKVQWIMLIPFYKRIIFGKSLSTITKREAFGKG